MDKKRLIAYALICLLLAGFSVYGVVRLTARKGGGPAEGQPGKQTPRDKQAVYLYFAAAADTYLLSEKRTISGASDPAGLSKHIIEALIRGPVKRDLVRTLPEDAACRALYLADNGVAYVDFSADIRDKHPGGSESELLAIYSIVNSLVLNVDEIDKVKILIEGDEAETLAGHIDLRLPFDANMRMVR